MSYVRGAGMDNRDNVSQITFALSTKYQGRIKGGLAILNFATHTHTHTHTVRSLRPHIMDTTYGFSGSTTGYILKYYYEIY